MSIPKSCHNPSLTLTTPAAQTSPDMAKCANTTLQSQLNCTSLMNSAESMTERVVVVGTLLVSTSGGVIGNTLFLLLADTFLPFDRVTLVLFR